MLVLHGMGPQRVTKGRSTHLGRHSEYPGITETLLGRQVSDARVAGDRPRGRRIAGNGTDVEARQPAGEGALGEARLELTVGQRGRDESW